MLKLEHVSYQVTEEGQALSILNDVSLTIEDNRFIVITGPNGGGKTTLAKIIMGLVTPTSGSIFYNGTDITHLGITERAKLGISYGFQQPPRFKGLRVRDLLELAAGNTKLPREACCQYLTRVGLCADDYVDREVDASLSGGEVKRIEIATILARQSGLLIFDEPEAGIDLWSFSRLIETFQSIRQQRNVTLLIISHQERIISLADEILLVADGEIRHRGPKEEIFPLIMADTVSGCCYMNEGAHK
ncbi:MAG: ATP-binding cassette domain-containing protein [Oscillospiraceae bacterium]|jgi:Fe-S cluster assembly ATP-binding protein|nr:ATP-binding cassette domain-containing protein [Oscillospiraceae bacterium]